MRIRTLALVCAIFVLSSCLADLEGGDPRIQVHNTWADTIRAVSIGEWKHDFDPPVAPGASSEIIELPVAGAFDISVWARRDGRDTLLLVQRVVVGLGEFDRIE